MSDVALLDVVRPVLAGQGVEIRAGDQVVAWLRDGSTAALGVAVGIEEWNGRLAVLRGEADIDDGPELVETGWVAPEALRSFGERGIRQRSHDAIVALRAAMDGGRRGPNVARSDALDRSFRVLRALSEVGNQPWRRQAVELLESHGAVGVAAVELTVRLMDRLGPDRSTQILAKVGEMPSLPGKWVTDAIGDLTFLDQYHPDTLRRIIPTFFEELIRDTYLAIIRVEGELGTPEQFHSQPTSTIDWLYPRCDADERESLCASSLPLSDAFIAQLTGRNDLTTSSYLESIATSRRQFSLISLGRLARWNHRQLLEDLLGESHPMPRRLVQHVLDMGTTGERYALAMSSIPLADEQIDRVIESGDDRYVYRLLRSSRPLRTEHLDQILEQGDEELRGWALASHHPLSDETFDRYLSGQSHRYREALVRSRRDLSSAQLQKLIASVRPQDLCVMFQVGKHVLPAEAEAEVAKFMTAEGKEEIEPSDHPIPDVIVEQLVRNNSPEGHRSLIRSGRPLADWALRAVVFNDDEGNTALLAGFRTDLPDDVRAFIVREFSRDIDVDRRAAVALGCGGGVLPVGERLLETASSMHHPLIRFPRRPTHWEQLPIGRASLPFKISRDVRDIEGLTVLLDGVPYEVETIKNREHLISNRREMANCTYDLRIRLSFENFKIIRFQTRTPAAKSYRVLNVAIERVSHIDIATGEVRPVWEVVEMKGIGNSELNSSMTRDINGFLATWLPSFEADE